MPCKHLESKQYVLALDEKANARAVMDSIDDLLGAATNEALTPRHIPVITWCRACGAVQGWKPTDDPSDGMWQLPDATPDIAKLESQIVWADGEIKRLRTVVRRYEEIAPELLTPWPSNER